MEHEDNANLNFLQGSQHLMENLQMASGDSMCDNVVDEIGINIGGKFEEHEVHDDEEEWKYIKEGQQSEKLQQQMKADICCKDMVGEEAVGNGNGYTYEHGNIGDDGITMVHQHEVDNGVVSIKSAADADVNNSAPGLDDVEIDITKNDGEFSTISNTTSTNGKGHDFGTNILQVEMKIESASPVDLLLAQHSEELAVKALAEDDEQSSMATNTSNGTNSPSENEPEEGVQQKVVLKSDEEFFVEDKENADPFLINAGCGGNNENEISPVDVNFEMTSQLNPNAIEFVPSFDSNPASPTGPMSDDAKFEKDVSHDEEESELKIQQIPSFKALHLIPDDDFVAQSPRKGSGESTLDGIAIPEVIDFEHEASKRPHELEQEDDLIDTTTQHNELSLLENCIKKNENVMNEVCLIDHGPETSVDLDIDVDIQSTDAEKMSSKQLFPKEAIEDVLNTVQQLPIDLYVSSDDDLLQQGSIAGKESLDIEEKENIFNSPSTDEIQTNMQNDLQSTANNIMQIDMNSAAHMQESFYLENTSSEIKNETHIKRNYESDEFNVDDNRYFPSDNISPREENIGLDETPYELMRSIEPNVVQPVGGFGASPASLNLFVDQPTVTQADTSFNMISPSPISTEEKHLLEETKEQAPKNENISELEQKMDNITLSSNDDILSQVEEVAQTAANIVECMNPFTAPELDKDNTIKQSPVVAEQNEQIYHNEQNEQHQIQENLFDFAHHENDLSATPAVNQPRDILDDTKPEINSFEKSIPESHCVEGSIVISAEHELITAEPGELFDEPKAQLLESEHGKLPQPDPTMDQHKSEVISTLDVGSDIIPNVSAEDENSLVSSEIPTSITEDNMLESNTDKDNSFTEKGVIGAASVAAATVAVATIAVKADKNPDAKKSRTPTSNKTKTIDVKKAAEPIRKALGTATKTSVSTTSAARPRTAPAKISTVSEKKPAIPSTTTNRKPLTSTATTTKAITKSTTARPIATLASAKPTSCRTIPTTTARRSAPTSTSGPAANSNGSIASKSKVSSAAPTKPTTLGIPATSKPKLSSPRTTLTSQLRKAAPPTTGTGLGTARSPLKPTSSTTNAISKSIATTMTASRSKTSASTTITTTTTKTFTARPAPKTTHSSTISSTTTRRTVGSVSSTTSTGTKTSSSILQKKTPPGGNTRSITSGKSSLSPTKTSSATLKVKTKDASGKSVTPTKSAYEPIRKPKKEQCQINGIEATGDIGNQSEMKSQLNGKDPQEQLENGIHQTDLENGKGPIMEQDFQASLIDA